jgi:Spy/CpxP family protein refolding chaperone
MVLVLGILLSSCFVSVKAQDETPDEQTNNRQTRPRLLAALDLTPEQIQQIRRINQENRPQLREANMKLREAMRNLDTAIYNDVVDETEVQTRIKAVHSAHSEMIKMRAQTEFAVRKILTPAQLVKFREIRQQSILENENLPKLRNNRRLNDPKLILNNRLRRNRQLN